MTVDFDYAYQNYSRLVYRIGILFFKDKTLAEDLVQDCFLALLEQTVEFNDEGHLKGWLITAARNKSKNILKRNKRFLPLDDSLPAKDGGNPVLDEIFKLKTKERLAVYLFYYEGYSSREIAELTNTTDFSVRSRLKRARAELKEMLE